VPPGSRWSQHAAIANLMETRWRHKAGKLAEEIKGLEDDVGGSVAPAALEAREALLRLMPMAPAAICIRLSRAAGIAARMLRRQRSSCGSSLVWLRGRHLAALRGIRKSFDDGPLTEVFKSQMTVCLSFSTTKLPYLLAV